MGTSWSGQRRTISERAGRTDCCSGTSLGQDSELANRHFVRSYRVVYRPCEGTYVAPSPRRVSPTSWFAHRRGICSASLSHTHSLAPSLRLLRGEFDAYEAVGHGTPRCVRSTSNPSIVRSWLWRGSRCRLWVIPSRSLLTWLGVFRHTRVAHVCTCVCVYCMCFISCLGRFFLEFAAGRRVCCNHS